ncbi:MAG: restriction endonuclease subunit S [Sedimenticola sp.]
MIFFKLKEITQIRAGYAFRGRLEADPEGEYMVVQMKDMDKATGVNWEQLNKTNLTGRTPRAVIEPGDLLFVARGHANFAVAIGEVPSLAVPSPHFFHLRVLEETGIDPEFLAWQINQDAIQRYLAQSAEGTQIPSIRRAVLEETLISVPDTKTQQRIVSLNKAMNREVQLYEALATNRRRMMKLVASQLLESDK